MGGDRHSVVSLGKSIKYYGVIVKVSFLNKKVQDIVESDPLLYVAWHLRHEPYDNDLDPVHNKYWIKLQCIIEEEKLIHLRHDVNQQLASYTSRKSQLIG